MGHRISKVYTRTGDTGETGLGDGSRVRKDSVRISTMGDIDELNCLLGVLLCETLADDIKKQLRQIQHNLFDLGGEFSIPGHIMIQPQYITQLEQFLDQLNESLTPLKEFILPGGSRAAALCHQARAVCRRAERQCVTARQQDNSINPLALQYLNRLSDLLFVMARTINQQAGQPDVLWSRTSAPS